MEGYEFLAAIQRLSLIASMLEKTDVEGVMDHLGYAETVAPLFGDADPARLSGMRGFVAKTLDYKRVCAAYRDQLSQAEATAGRTRRQLVTATDHPDPAPTVTSLGPGGAG